MTLDELKALTHAALDIAKERFETERRIPPFVIMVTPDRSEFIVVPGEIMSDASAKRHLFALLKRAIQGKKAQALVLVSDGWTLDYTEAQLKYTATPEGGAELLRISGGPGGAPAAAAAGFGTLMECINANAQMPGHTYSLMQMYHRVAKDGVIPGSALVNDGPPENHTIRFYGEPVILSSENGHMSGRMMGLFDEEEEHV